MRNNKRGKKTVTKIVQDKAVARKPKSFGFQNPATLPKEELRRRALKAHATRRARKEAAIARFVQSLPAKARKTIVESTTPKVEVAVQAAPIQPEQLSLPNIGWIVQLAQALNGNQTPTGSKQLVKKSGSERAKRAWITRREKYGNNGTPRKATKQSEYMGPKELQALQALKRLLKTA